MQASPQKLEYAPALREKMQQDATGTWTITQTAGEGSLFFVHYLKRVIGVAISTPLPCLLIFIALRHRSFADFFRPPGVVLMFIWFSFALGLAVAFLQRRQPLVLQILSGGMLISHRPFAHPMRCSIRKVADIRVKRQLLFGIPLRFWQIRAYADELPIPAISFRVSRLPSIAVLWYRDPQEAKDAAAAIRLLLHLDGTSNEKTARRLEG